MWMAGWLLQMLVIAIAGREALREEDVHHQQLVVFIHNIQGNIFRNNNIVSWRFR